MRASAEYNCCQSSDTVSRLARVVLIRLVTIVSIMLTALANSESLPSTKSPIVSDFPRQVSDVSSQANGTYSQASDIAIGINGTSNLSAIGPLMLTLDAYMSAVNRIDIQGVTNTYQFPHFRVAGGVLSVWNTAVEAMPMLVLPIEEQKHAMRKALGDDWSRTEWLRRDVISMTDKKAHVDTEFVRIDSKGKAMGRFRSLYILVKVDRTEPNTAQLDTLSWKIIGRSSYAP